MRVGQQLISHLRLARALQVLVVQPRQRSGASAGGLGSLSLGVPVSIYDLFVVPPSLVSAAILVAVIRANKDDLPTLIRALMGKGGDDGPTPPQLPKPLASSRHAADPPTRGPAGLPSIPLHLFRPNQWLSATGFYLAICDRKRYVSL